MNREFLLEAVLGITLGLLIAVLAVYRTAKAPKPGALRRGGMIAVLVYAVLGSSVIVRTGMTWLGLLVLLVLVCLPVAALLVGRQRPAPEGEVAVWVRRGVSVGLTAAMLIAAGQTISLVSLVDPRVLVVVIAVMTGLLVAAQGLAASGRVGSLAMWLLIVPVLISLALGILLGKAGQAVDRIIEVDGLSLWTAISLGLAFLALGRADAGLASSRDGGKWSPLRLLAGVFGVVILISFGLLMFFGGAILSPSMQFFVVPANIDAVPGLAGLLLVILTVLFTALVASPMNGLHTQGADGWRWVARGATLAVVLALLDPGMDVVVIATSLLAAAFALARSARGVMLGLVVAVAALIALVATTNTTFGWPSALALLVVAGVAAVPGPVSQPVAAGQG